MRFKIDKNLPADVGQLVREFGFDARTLLDQGAQGRSDARIVEMCLANDETLITLDLGFADIKTYPPSDHAGFVVVRLSHQDKRYVLSVLERALPEITKLPLIGHLVIVEETRIRVYPAE